MEKRLLTIMLTLLMSMVAKAQVTINSANFPDDIFRQYVSDVCDTDGDGTLSDSELARKIVTVQDKGIASLQG